MYKFGQRGSPSPQATVLAMALSVFMYEDAVANDCVCHAVIVCGADSCDAAGEPGADLNQSCAGATISAEATTGALSICAFGECWKGDARYERLSNNDELWVGRLHRSSDSSQIPSDVFLYLNSGVGFAQISDESGPMQISLTCTP